ncbi:unnamed protein product [Allacma fusca]|uniref:SOCS box domain-containing protein n=1 Tax=Allacma fusca TaxID=39272 RepID=A0A8J2JVZ3_9HEXA|nr:unnamed protein product [Allacma fusca]
MDPKIDKPLGTARKIGELRRPPAEDFSNDAFSIKIARGLQWHVTFAPDESRLAWIASPQKVILVPWDSQNNCLATSCYSPEGSSGAVKKPNEKLAITIECGYPVVSVAFGKGKPKNSLLDSKASYWTRFDSSKLIILATGHTNGRIRVWDGETGRLLLELMDHAEAVRDLAFAPDGSLRLISASLDGKLKGWDLNDDGNMFKTFVYHKGPVVSISWSPTSKLLASASYDKTVGIWNMTTYKLINKLVGHFNNVSCCCFSPDGAVLATSSWDTQVILWDPYTGTRLRTLYHMYPVPNLIYASGLNNAWVRAVSYSFDGMSIVTTSDDNLIRFWNLMGDEDPEGIAAEAEGTLCCTYSPSGRSVAVGTELFRLKFFATQPQVPPLMHLARMAVRKIVDTKDVDKLWIPRSLKLYLTYRSWN